MVISCSTMTDRSSPFPGGPVGDDLPALARSIATAPPGGASSEEAGLYRVLAPRIRLYGLKHLRDGTLADDLVQQVLVTVIEGLRSGKVREPEQIASYALGTSRIIAVDLKRGERRRRDLLHRYASTFATTTAATEPLDVQPLADCLGRLVERDRAVVVLTFYAERSSDEIAAELALSAANVRVVRHRALLRLRECMESGDRGEPS